MPNIIMSSFGEFIDGLDGIERALIIAILYITAVTIIIVAEYGRNRK
jgi:hypothetical protein